MTIKTFDETLFTNEKVFLVKRLRSQTSHVYANVGKKSEILRKRVSGEREGHPGSLTISHDFSKFDKIPIYFAQSCYKVNQDFYLSQVLKNMTLHRGVLIRTQRNIYDGAFLRK